MIDLGRSIITNCKTSNADKLLTVKEIIANQDFIEKINVAIA